MPNIIITGPKAKKILKIVDKLQSRMAIRITNVYKTILRGSKSYIEYCADRAHGSRKCEENVSKKLIREETLEEWLNIWKRNSAKANWTKQLISHISPWINQGLGEVKYHITRSLSRHGCTGTSEIPLFCVKNGPENKQT